MNTQQISLSERPALTVVYFFAPNCVACKMMPPTLKMVDEFDDVLLIKQDIYEDQDWAASENVSSLPTIIIFDNDNNEVERLTGFVKPEKFYKILAKHYPMYIS